MQAHIVYAALLCEGTDTDRIADEINEILSPCTRLHSPTSCILDYVFACEGLPPSVTVDVAEHYVEAPFLGLAPVPTAMVYEFLVKDRDGVWGAIRAFGATEQAARETCTTDLREEVDPHGSLLPGFTLTLHATSPVAKNPQRPKRPTPPSTQCSRCGSNLNSDGFCQDKTCPFSDHLPGCDCVKTEGDACTCGGRIAAEVYSDDHQYELNFTANTWFKQASLDEIMALVNINWGGEQAADQVALGLEDQNPDIARIMEYCRNNQARHDPVGFECHVDKNSAIKWLKVHRPEVAVAVLKATGH